MTNPFNTPGAVLFGAGYTIRIDSSDPGTLLVIDHETGDTVALIDSDMTNAARVIEAIRRLRGEKPEPLPPIALPPLNIPAPRPSWDGVFFRSLSARRIDAVLAEDVAPVDPQTKAARRRAKQAAFRLKQQGERR